VALGCGLPHGGGSGAGCPYQGSAFGGDVDLAIEQAQKEHPELFDFNDGYGKLSWRVPDRKKYYDLVKYNLERMGYCAAHDEEEIGVKNDNRFNEQFQIMTSYGYSRWGRGGVPGHLLAALVLSRTTNNEQQQPTEIDRPGLAEIGCHPGRSAILDRLRMLRLGPQPGRAAHATGIAMHRGAERRVDPV
jgi:hypothetical protein